MGERHAFALLPWLVVRLRRFDVNNAHWRGVRRVGSAGSRVCPVRSPLHRLVGGMRNRWPGQPMAEEHHKPIDHDNAERQWPAVDVVVPSHPPVLTPSAAAVLLRILHAAVRNPRSER